MTYFYHGFYLNIFEKDSYANSRFFMKLENNTQYLDELEDIYGEDFNYETLTTKILNTGLLKETTLKDELFIINDLTKMFNVITSLNFNSYDYELHEKYIKTIDTHINKYLDTFCARGFKHNRILLEDLSNEDFFSVFLKHYIKFETLNEILTMLDEYEYSYDISERFKLAGLDGFDVIIKPHIEEFIKDVEDFDNLFDKNIQISKNMLLHETVNLLNKL